MPLTIFDSCDIALVASYGGNESVEGILNITVKDVNEPHSITNLPNTVTLDTMTGLNPNDQVSQDILSTLQLRT